MGLWSKDHVSYERAILNEISTLLSYIADCPTKTLQNLRLPNAQQSGRPFDASDILSRLSTIEAKLDADDAAALCGAEMSFLLLVRDALNDLAKPACGLTVAYTAMVVGDRRGTAKSRAKLAGQAYAGLAFTARLHRWGQGVMIGFAILLTMAAVWDSAKVALGKSLLHNLQDLRVKQEAIDQEKLKLEQALSEPASNVAPLVQLAGDGHVAGVQQAYPRFVIRLCDRPAILARHIPAPREELLLSQWHGHPAVFETAAEQDVCDRDLLLAHSFSLAQSAIGAYLDNWPKMVGMPFHDVGRLVSHLIPPRDNPLTTIASDDKYNDVELLVAPVLLVLANYILPVVFAMVGAAAFVILDYYGKIRASLLTPRDLVVSWIRLVLGSVVGACIGLFFSSYGPSPRTDQVDLVGAITLSASGLSFLAGFGVEGVFTLLEGLVKRIFTDKPA